MKRNLKIPAPFFEIGPKNYLYGQDVVDLAKAADELSRKYRVSVIFTTPYTVIAEVAAATESLYVFAPHMDSAPVGRGLANVLPEALKAAGVKGVMLNHTEKPLSIAELGGAIERARTLRLMTIVCATSITETRAVAVMNPDMIVSEPLDRIGTGCAVETGYAREAMSAVGRINPDIGVLIGGGISTGEDVYKVIISGADASGASSAIACAADPIKKVDEMLRAARQAWDDRNSLGEQGSKETISLAIPCAEERKSSIEQDRKDVVSPAQPRAEERKSSIEQDSKDVVSPAQPLKEGRKSHVKQGIKERMAL